MGNDQRTVFVRDGRSFARKNGLAFIETSALDATGLDTAFQRILQEIYKTQTKKQLNSNNNKKAENGQAPGNGNGPVTRGKAINLMTEPEPSDLAQTKARGCC